MQRNAIVITSVNYRRQLWSALSTAARLQCTVCQRINRHNHRTVADNVDATRDTEETTVQAAARMTAARTGPIVLTVVDRIVEASVSKTKTGTRTHLTTTQWTVLKRVQEVVTTVTVAVIVPAVLVIAAIVDLTGTGARETDRRAQAARPRQVVVAHATVATSIG